MSCVSFNIERSCADCGMWTQTLYHLYGVPLEAPFTVMSSRQTAFVIREDIPDIGCHRQILDLHVKCSHSGCSWIGELRTVEKHQSECLFKVVKCPNSGCTKMLSKRDMKTHETLECSWRKVNCEYCQESVIMK